MYVYTELYEKYHSFIKFSSELKFEMHHSLIKAAQKFCVYLPEHYVTMPKIPLNIQTKLGLLSNHRP